LKSTMASRISYLVILAAWIAALWWGLDFAGRQKAPPVAVPTKDLDWPEFFAANILPSLPVADEFDTPLRPPDGRGAVVSFPFQERGNLGESWTTAKGDAALGEPVYSVADGWVSVAQDFQNAFGKVVFICYRLPEGRWPPFVEVMYAELNSIDVKPGQFVKRGDRIGTVGDGDGTYSVASGGAGASLRWEVRQTVGLGLGPGFEANASGWLGPSEFIVAHRGPRAKQPLLVKVLAPNERPGWGTDY
jgi:murein DD-endopeptidase MepM/ murein hydrolase activator NlpD